MNRAPNKAAFVGAVARTKGRGVHLAYYACHPITGQWACRWCRSPLASNRVECPCWKGLRE
jgi:hypothetical protein